jgi:hypothetical protein
VGKWIHCWQFDGLKQGRVIIKAKMMDGFDLEVVQRLGMEQIAANSIADVI